MARTDDVIPGPPEFIDNLDPVSFGLPPGWEAMVWTDGLLIQLAGKGAFGVMEFPDYPGEFYVTYFSEDECVESMTGPFPNAATAVALIELTKT